MPNLLAAETSPYLLQHAENPVDWMPWGEAALERARRENKPIFLSIGYAACHWCHVMAHESFENPATAAIMNEHFVNIKVDREERPDLDGIYMNAVVAMTGQGGWPMSVFLTPDGQPFYGGTYFPPSPRFGMPSFTDILQAAAKAWEENRSDLQDTARKLTHHLREATHWETAGSSEPRPGLLDQATQTLLAAYSWQQAGWGRAPLFPQPMSVEFLLLQATRGNRQALEAACHNLRAMERGGMYDVIGGGFHRYSTDAYWLVPHFEKMLYDNAQLSLVYLHAFLLTGDLSFRRTCEETLDFVLRELRHPSGGFYSSLDADSEGEEGRFYLWTTVELREVLAPLGLMDLFNAAYDLSEDGNFEGRVVLRRRAADKELAQVFGLEPSAYLAELARGHRALLAIRSRRIRPATDDKVLTSWNALTLRALAEAARYLKRGDYLDAARENADFVLRELRSQSGLLRAWRKGQARHDAYLEDYAALILGLLALYQSDPDQRWYDAAEQLTAAMIDLFRDTAGGFFDVRRDSPALFTQPKDSQDNATPCGNSLAALALLWMTEYTGNHEWRDLAGSSLASLQDGFVRHPAAFAMWLQALDFYTGPVYQVAVSGDPQDPHTKEMHGALWSVYRPRLVAASASAGAISPPLLEGRPLLEGKPTAYVCQGFTCRLPVNTPDGLRAQLDEIS